MYTKQQLEQQERILLLKRQWWHLQKERAEVFFSILFFILLIPAVPILCMVFLNWMTQAIFMFVQMCSFRGGDPMPFKTFGICEMSTLQLDYFPFYYTTVYAKFLCAVIPIP